MSWRFARRPKWIIRHGLVAALVVTMVLLGLWQLRRLDEKRELKARVEARQDEPAVDVLSVVPREPAAAEEAIADIEHRAVTAVGTYLDEDTFVVENRTFNGTSGAWVLTPLRLADGSAVVVNRGFVGFDREGVIVPPLAPAGKVTVDGVLLDSEHRGRFGPSDPESGDLEVLARVDLERVSEQVDYDVLPAYVQRVRSTPDEVAESGAPALVALGRPVVTEGPHLSYAVQWFIFTTIAAVGYGLLLRRVARDEARDVAAAEADAALDRELADLLDPRGL